MNGEQVKSSVYDVVVVGAGPSGISAAINVANRKRSVVVFDSQQPFSYTRRAPQVPNYPGFSFSSGDELAAAFIAHLEGFSVPVIGEKVTRVSREVDELLVLTESDMYHAQAVILATGAYREAELEGEAELIGAGVSYCANCDGRLFAGRDVVFVSYLPEGEEEAAVLAEDLGCTVTYVPLYAGRPRVPDGVRVLPRERPERLFRVDGKVHVRLRREELVADGVFIYKRTVSPQDLVDGLALEDGYVAVNRHMETGIPGIFAAGDATGEPFQIAKAVGEGQVAALQALRYLREGRTTRPQEPPALKPEDRELLARVLRERADQPVQLTHFTQLSSEESPVTLECGTCRETRRLLEELVALSPKLSLRVFDLAHDRELAARLGVERIPATLVGRIDDEVPRHRFFGLPSGYEFGPFFDCILETSTGKVRLADETVGALERLQGPVHIEVLTTPTCPRCPDVARLALRFAAASPQVSADVVVVSEFPDVAQRYQVMAVPRIAVDGVIVDQGAGEAGLLSAIEAIGSQRRG